MVPEPFYPAHVDLGALCETKGQSPDALRVFETALTHFPDDAVLHFNRAVALDMLDLFDEATQGYERCLAINSDMPMRTTIWLSSGQTGRPAQPDSATQRIP